MDQATLIDENFPLFSKSRNKHKPPQNPTAAIVNTPPKIPQIEKSTDTKSSSSINSKFFNLGLAEWVVNVCKELVMRKPTPVQTHCIPKILAGLDVLGLAQTGSGKTNAFTLPILHRLAENPFGVFALVVTPTRELAYQLAEQFRALGSCLHLRCSVVVGGMDMLNQTQSLLTRPHVDIATPGRIKVLLEENPNIPHQFLKCKSTV